MKKKRNKRQTKRDILQRVLNGQDAESQRETDKYDREKVDRLR